MGRRRREAARPPSILRHPVIARRPPGRGAADFGSVLWRKRNRSGSRTLRPPPWLLCTTTTHPATAPIVPCASSSGARTEKAPVPRRRDHLRRRERPRGDLSDRAGLRTSQRASNERDRPRAARGDRGTPVVVERGGAKLSVQPACGTRRRVISTSAPSSAIERSYPGSGRRERSTCVASVSPAT